VEKIKEAFLIAYFIGNISAKIIKMRSCMSKLQHVEHVILFETQGRSIKSRR